MEEGRCAMTDILIRDVNGKALARLKARAKRNGRSLQGEAKLILENAAGSLTLREAVAMARQWQTKLSKNGKKFSDSAELIREGREERDR